MKLRIFSIIFLSVFVLCVSCSKNKFLDVNADPNNPLDVPPKTLLPVTTIGIGWASSNEIGKAAGVLVQYNSGISSNAAEYDNWIIASLDNQWNSEVYAPVYNMNLLISKTEATSPIYSGIAKLQKAYMMSIATDLWGDVPYSQAGQRLDFPQPRFDKQQDIYLGNSTAGIQSLFNLVRSGLADLTKTGTLRPTTDDIVYGGDVTKWTRVGNTLLLKFALQVSNVAPDTTKSVINALLSSNAPLIDSSIHDLNIPFSSNSQNAYWLQDIGGSINNTEMLSARFLAIMRGQNDSLLLSKIYTKPSATFIGYDNGSPFTAPVLATRSVYGNFVAGLAGEAPVRLLTSYRTAFILAEAALRFGATGDANLYFQAGIRRFKKAAGLTDAEIVAYFAANPTFVNLSGTTDNKLRQIIIQKYIASVGNGLEAYNDYRRTGYPVLPPPQVTKGDDPTTLPKRLTYVSSEANANPNQPNPRPLTNVKVWWAL